MINLSTIPGKMKALLAVCLTGIVASLGITLYVYNFVRSTSKAVGTETVPSIVAAKRIRATLADAHSNAMNAMVTKEKLGGGFWNLYRKDLNNLHSMLIDASKNINYGDAERIPLLTILSNISAYEYTVGGAVSSESDISVDQFMEANRLMQQKILPASSALGKVNLSKLDSVYSGYTEKISGVSSFVLWSGVFLLAILAGTQIYMFKKTRRIFNMGLLAASVVVLVSLVYSLNSLNNVKSSLYAAKQGAFESLNSLWSARAEAYNANALESLYLLHHGTGIVQTADTINFNLAASRICSDKKAASNGTGFEGYLSDGGIEADIKQNSSTAGDTLQQWIKYVDIDSEIRNLEYDSRHDEAIALCVGNSTGQSNYEFTKFDDSLEERININQKEFEDSMSSAFKTLNIFPYITAALMILAMGTCTLGLKVRIDEYKA
ncbi:MAG: hypothetical protein Q8930_10610 [Bacillota bacterium]|nr:hypothetical protein [Bacillota bacterium]